MNRKFGISILALCFGLSSVNASLAAQSIEISPVVVQPCDLREISQQMLEQDRINRDQELAVRGLIDDNQKITNTALARQQDATLEKINQTMIHYRDALLSRERARIAANSQKVSKYHDLIALTEDVDGMKGVGQTLQLKSNVIELKDETIKQQGLALQDKDESIRWLNQVVAVAKNKAKYYQLTSQQDRLTMEQLQKEMQPVVGLRVQLSQKQQQVDLLKSELENKITEAENQAQQEARVRQDFKAKLQDKENQITAMKTAIQLGQETAQSDTLRQQLADQQNTVDLLEAELDSKNAQSDQMTLMMSDYQKKLESKDNAYNQELRQALLAKNNQARMEKQIAYLNAQLQEKEAQVVKIKKEMYDLQELKSAKDRDLQAKNLSLSIEYEKKFKEQSQEFQSLKDQLLNARMEITRLKDRSQISQSDLQKQVMALTQKLEACQEKTP